MIHFMILLSLNCPEKTYTTFHKIRNYSTFSNEPNRDGFELYFVKLLSSAFGKDFSKLINLRYPRIENQEICQVDVLPSNKPEFIKFEGREEFYVRLGCSSEPLSRQEQSKYERTRWP